MTPDQAYAALAARMRQAALLESTEGLLHWDRQTGLPPKAASWRADQEAGLALWVHRLTASPEVGDLLSRAASLPAAADASSPEAVNLREWARDYERRRRLPDEFVEEFARTCSAAERAWEEARRFDDFPLFAPHLSRVRALAREKADRLGFRDHPLDALLEDYEPGLAVRDVEALLRPLTKRLRNLLERIGSRGNALLLRRSAPLEAQKALCREALEQIGFDFAAGRLDESAHPFTTRLGPRDVRLTTRYDENDFSVAFFGALHEGGHGLYDQGLPPEHYGTPRGEPASLSVHESQSRLWENRVGRGEAFWEFFLPRLKARLPAFDGVGLPDLLFAVNAVAPSLLRTESDEITYNLHVVLRFEIEKELLEGSLEVSSLPERWREGMRSWLGVVPETDREGCLQDIHWSGGAFGYFPTYTLGNLFSAQLWEAAERDLGNLDAQHRRGDFRPLQEWLRDRVHRWGRTFQSVELVRRACGEDPSPEPFLRYLEGKFKS